MADDIKTRPAVEQPEGENASDTEKVRDVHHISSSGGSCVDDEGGGLYGGGWLALHDGGDSEVRGGVHGRSHGIKMR